MLKVEVSVVINRPVEEIFEFLANPENDPKWQSGVLEAEQTSKGPRGVGTTDREARKFMGRQFDQTFVVTEYEPNRMIKKKTTSGPMAIDTSYAFESVEGGTKVTLVGGGDVGGFFKLADPLISRMAKRQIEADLANLKDMLEAQD
jgi:uncharacterized protein YndB with AHSA1/START domain